MLEDNEKSSGIFFFLVDTLYQKNSDRLVKTIKPGLFPPWYKLLSPARLFTFSMRLLI